jgi:hypothetical protein
VIQELTLHTRRWTKNRGRGRSRRPVMAIGLRARLQFTSSLHIKEES